MAGSITIRSARLVLPDRVVKGDLVVVDGVIEQIGPELGRSEGEEVDGTGLTVLPGLIDPLLDVPFVDDGTPLSRVSGEAAAWGVTSLLLHDTHHRASTTEALRERLDHAVRHCRVHFGVYAVADPEHLEGLVDLERTPGVRACVGACSGVPALEVEQLDQLFSSTDRVVVVEGRDGSASLAREALYADPVDPAEHSRIYTPELSASMMRQVIAAARRRGARVHMARVSGAAELEVLAEAGDDGITAQVTVPHLFLHAPEAYERLGVRAVTEPPLREADDVRALWAAVEEGRIVSVASGHGSVGASEKDRPYPLTPRALPTGGATLPLLLQRVHEGRLSLLQVARLTAEGPARTFGLARTGRLEVGYDADLVLVDAHADVSAEPPVPSWSGWTPFRGVPARGRVMMTLLRGRAVFRDGRLADGVRGRELTFPRP